MPRTNAQRQAKYKRGKHDRDEARLDIMIDYRAKARLKRLATCCGVSQKTLLEKLLESEDKKVMKKLSEEERETYIEGELKGRFVLG